MQNKTKTFPTFESLMREQRLVFIGIFERGDQRRVPATEAQIDGILKEGGTLQEQLAKLKQLERGRRTKDSIKEIKKLKADIEKSRGVRLSDQQMEDMIHELIEKHDQEVGTAIEFQDGKYALIHASESAVKLVLKKQEAQELSFDGLKLLFEQIGFQVDNQIYKKNEIPTARPFSKVLEDGWEVEVDDSDAVSSRSGIREAAIQDNTPVGRPVETLLKAQGFRQYKGLLDKVFGEGKEVRVEGLDAEAAASAPTKIESWKQFLAEYKKAGHKPENIQKVIRRGKDVTEKVQESLRSKKAEIKIGDVITFQGGRVGKTQRIESPAHQFFRNPSEANRQAFSSLEFARRVEASNLTSEQKQELIEAAIRLDVTVTARRVRESGSGRGVFLERQAIKTQNGGKQVQELFDRELGTKLDLTGVYQAAPEKSPANKNKIRDILSGESTVFMLRIDRVQQNGKFDSRVEKTRGSAWLGDLEAPRKLRSDKGYEYKYAEIDGSAQKQEILKKYLNREINPAEAAKYQIAQVEIPNCENPAIVIKKLDALPPPPPPPEAPKKKVKISLTAVQYFKNVPKGWTYYTPFRALDWFKPDSQFNHLADPAIVDLKGKTLREGEYVNARKRLSSEPHKFLAEQVDDTLGFLDGSIRSETNKEGEDTGRTVLKSLDRYLGGTSSIEGQEKSREQIISDMARDLRARIAAAGPATGPDSFKNRTSALEGWRKVWSEKGADDKMIQMAGLLDDWDCKNVGELREKMVREDEAFKLISFARDSRSETSLGMPVEEYFRNGKQSGLYKILEKWGVDLSGKTVSEAIESALYDEDKLNIARNMRFIGDAIVVPPTVDSKGKQKLVLHEAQSGLLKELLNVHSPASLLLEVASIAQGWIMYVRTGTGRADALGEYLSKAKGSPEAKAFFEKIFHDQATFDAFRDFVLKGQVPGTGGNKI
ncbi:MAG: hypothetical protein V1936_04515, partial [Patescibacteria group bacterium]